MINDPRQALVRAQSLVRAIRSYWSREGRYTGGQHTISQKGEGIQWADIRHYQAGDEVKSISWKHSSRSPNETWVKTFEIERAHRFVLLLDRSASMVQGVLQNRYHRAWWVSAVMGYLFLKQKDLCAIFNSDARSQRHQLKYLHNDTHMTQWAFNSFDKQNIKFNSDPLHIQLQKLSSVLKRYTSIVLLTDGYDHYESLYKSLKVLSKNHEVLTVLFPDLFHVSDEFCQLSEKNKWRFFCFDTEEEHAYFSQIRHVSEEWKHFWFNLRLPQVKVSTCRPEDDEVMFIRKLLKR